MERIDSVKAPARAVTAGTISANTVTALTATALALGALLCACAPTPTPAPLSNPAMHSPDPDMSLQAHILPELPEALPQIVSGADCKEIGPAIDFAAIQGMCLDEPQDAHALYPEIGIGGAATIAETSTLAFTFYCDSGGKDLVFGVADPNSSEAPITVQASCAEDGAANYESISIFDQWVGKEVVVYGPAIDFTMLAAYAWIE